MPEIANFSYDVEDQELYVEILSHVDDNWHGVCEFLRIEKMQWEDKEGIDPSCGFTIEINGGSVTGTNLEDFDVKSFEMGGSLMAEIMKDQIGNLGF